MNGLNIENYPISHSERLYKIYFGWSHKPRDPDKLYRNKSQIENLEENILHKSVG